ncbi:MAG: TonB-dependent receptor [Kordiimonadaceae bacterium]|nr:TonB-dependent receptor [Kordiimonadaceae bacterium]
MMAVSCSALAQDNGQDIDDTGLGLEEIVVTGVAVGTAKLDTSVSVSSLNYSNSYKTAPRSLGEIYRSLPGIRSEPATGEGNGSISVRGIPLATGGYKYVQVQEDGLPVLQFGDIVAGNVPNYVRGDFTLQRIESIRGGSASTLTSYAPGGIINHISKTGEQEGGAIGASTGVNFDEFRLDFDYGGEIANDLFFHVGGFWREGEGTRDVGYNANSGGQIKANITKNFDNGYVRLFYKKLDDNIATYTRAPAYTDSANGGEFRPIPGFDGRDQAVSSVNRINVPKLDHLGNPIDRRTADHITAKVDAIGVEASFEFDDGWTFTNRFRTSDVRGDFNAPLALLFDDARNIASDGFWACGCANPVLSYANGPNEGQPFSGLALGILELDFNMDDLGLTVNDFRLTKQFENITLTGGLYYSSQNIRQTWNNWEFYIAEAVGDNAAGIAITDGDTGEVVSGPGGVSGNAFLAYSLDLNYETIAPYVDVSAQFGDLSLNASIRQDEIDVTGFATKAGKFFGTGVFPRDLNGDGDTDDPLDTVAISQEGFTDLATNADYSRSLTSFSIGANYRVSDDVGVFARYSKGGVLVADRLWDGSTIDNNRLEAANSGLLEGIDDVKQAEIGIKYNGDKFDIFATGFYAETEETQSEVTAQRVFTQTYEAWGLELETFLDLGEFTVNGNFTWTNAEIIEADNPAIIGNQPNRQADYIFTVTPAYTTADFSVGASFVGSGGFYHGDTETVRQDAYILVHAFASYSVTEHVSITLTANNLFNTFVNSFSESGVFQVNGQFANLAETLNGRTIAASIRYDF